MGTFVTAYAVVWLAVVLYVARLGAEQRRIRQALEALESRREDEDEQRRVPPVSDAA